MQDDGRISIRRYDLIIDVAGREATVDVDGSSSPTNMALEVGSRSLRVRQGEHGVKPLTDKDRAGIERDIEEKILRGWSVATRKRRCPKLSPPGTA